MNIWIRVGEHGRPGRCETDVLLLMLLMMMMMMQPSCADLAGQVLMSWIVYHSSFNCEEDKHTKLVCVFVLLKSVFFIRRLYYSLMVMFMILILLLLLFSRTGLNMSSDLYLIYALYLVSKPSGGLFCFLFIYEMTKEALI